MMKSTLPAIVLLLFLSLGATAQCDYIEKFRNDGTIIKDYEALSLIDNDSVHVSLGLSFEGSLKTLRFEIEIKDSMQSKWPKKLNVQLSDSTILILPYLSQTKQSTSNRQLVFYKFSQRDLGYLKTYKMIALQFYDQSNNLSRTEVQNNHDALILQLNCPRTR